MKAFGYLCITFGTLLQLLVPLGFLQSTCCSLVEIPTPLFNIFAGVLVQLFGFVLVCSFDLMGKARLLDAASQTEAA